MLAIRVLAEKGGASLALCWAHVRRRFYERLVSEASAIATEALQRDGVLIGSRPTFAAADRMSGAPSDRNDGVC